MKLVPDKQKLEQLTRVRGAWSPGRLSHLVGFRPSDFESEPNIRCERSRPTSSPTKRGGLGRDHLNHGSVINADTSLSAMCVSASGYTLVTLSEDNSLSDSSSGCSVVSLQGRKRRTGWGVNFQPHLLLQCDLWWPSCVFALHTADPHWLQTNSMTTYADDTALIVMRSQRTNRRWVWSKHNN